MQQELWPQKQLVHCTGGAAQAMRTAELQHKLQLLERRDSHKLLPPSAAAVFGPVPLLSSQCKGSHCVEFQRSVAKGEVECLECGLYGLAGSSPVVVALQHLKGAWSA